MAQFADRSVNEPLRARLHQAYQQYATLRAGMGEMQQRLASMQVSVTSEDKLITVTVGPRGQLVDLRFDPRVYSEFDPPTLARKITEAVRSAVARVGDQVGAVMAEYLPSDSPSLQYLRTFDLGTMMDRHDARASGSATADDR
ncbi:MAG: hypothetical protein QOE61_4471 [Micromonosporaceae bacterium]|jgi:DNA-binding protein YbaB|nr:hypothetical protein [Micromonosporaceae bacterium]